MLALPCPGSQEGVGASAGDDAPLLVWRRQLAMCTPIGHLGYRAHFRFVTSQASFVCTPGSMAHCRSRRHQTCSRRHNSSTDFGRSVLSLCSPFGSTITACARTNQQAERLRRAYTYMGQKLDLHWLKCAAESNFHVGDAKLFSGHLRWASCIAVCKSIGPRRF